MSFWCHVVAGIRPMLFTSYPTERFILLLLSCRFRGY